MTGIPDVPPADTAMREFLIAVKSTIETMVDADEALAAAVSGTNVDGAGDLIPPAAPIDLIATSTGSSVDLSWTNPGDDDLLLVEVWETTTAAAPNAGTDNPLNTVYATPASTGGYTRAGLPAGVTRYYWLRAVDDQGNASDFSASAEVYVTAGDGSGDGTAPSPPTGLTATAGFQNIWLTWTNPSDTDLVGTIIYEATINDSSTAMAVGNVPASSALGSTYQRAGLGNNVTRYYWVKAVDVDGNLSAFSSGVSATTATVAPGDLGTIVGFGAPTGLSVNSTIVTDADGMQVVNVNSSWTAIADGTISFYEVAISEASGSFIVFATSANNYTVINARGNTSYAVKVRGVDRNGNRTAYSATTTITSTNKTIGPAEAINARSTKIDPGQVLVHGSSTLASWRDGGDLTKINGGEIAANTVTANKVSIGLRGVDISGISIEPNSASFGSGVTVTNSVAWSSGSVVYIADGGAVTATAVTAGTVAYTGSQVYIYWTKGAGTLSATTSAATAYTANNVVMAIYGGGSSLFVTYGRTIIDGDSIKTGSVNANRIAAGTITTDLMSANTINGDRIAAGTLNANKIVTGSLTALQIYAGTITANEIVAAGISQFFATTPAATVAMNTTEQTFMTYTLATGDDDIVRVDAGVFIENFETTGRTVNWRIYRNAVMISDNSSYGQASHGFQANAWAVDEPPSNTSVVYTVKVFTTNGLSMAATDGRMGVTRWRR